MIRVVIADDQPLVRTGLRMILSSEPDMEVVAEAADGNAAIEAVAEHRPNVVLMDVRMPGTDGIEATRVVTAGDDPPRVLVLTTFDLDEIVYDALRAGASAFLLKDAPEERLTAAIRIVADGGSLFAPQRDPPTDRGVRSSRSRADRRPWRSDRPGDRGAPAGRPRDEQPGDRRAPVRHREHREDPCCPVADEARGPGPGAGGRGSVRVRPGAACRRRLTAGRHGSDGGLVHVPVGIPARPGRCTTPESAAR